MIEKGGFMDKSFAKTKIICTIGPATQEVSVLKEIMQAGMDVARINFSHGSHSEWEEMIQNVRTAANELGIHIPILGDLCGPKIRLSEVVEPFEIKDGEEFVITVEDVPGTREQVGTIYKELAQDVKPGNIILIDDGLIQVEVVKVEGPKVFTKVIFGGMIKSKKGMNLPDAEISIPALTDKDREDVEFGIAQEIDFFALSFVRKPEDVRLLKEVIHSKGKDVPVISKIEKPEAIRSIIEIIQESDGIMVARGDLGVEMKTEDVPILQKMIIEKANYYGTPVITATQMLDSMITNPRPTRAEASDVANAVFDGTDAVMLSAETSVGRFPVETVHTMNMIVRRVEDRLPMGIREDFAPYRDEYQKLAFDLARAACQMAEDSFAAAILAITKSGRTAMLLSQYRTMAPIITFTESAAVARSISLNWGVQGEVVDSFGDTDETIDMIKRIAVEKGYVVPGDTVVFVAGIPLHATTQVNMIKVERI
jgi:pyruvate kinase